MEAQGNVLRRGFRLIGRYIRTEPLTFTIAISGGTIFALSAVATTVVLGRVTDDLIIPAFEDGEASRSALAAAATALVIVTLLRAVSIVFRRYFGAMTGRRNQRHLRRGITDRYLSVPMSFFQSQPTGQLLAHADADVEAATELIYPLAFAVGVAALVFFSVISLALVDPLLTLVALFLFPLLAVMNRVYTARVEAPSAVVQENVGRVSTVAHESIDGALVVKTLGREPAEVDRLAAVADRLRQSRIRVGYLRAAFEPAIDAFPNVGIVALLALGSWEIAAGRITTGELVQAMALFGILAFPMRVLGFFLEEIPRGVVSIDRIDRVMAAPSAPTPELHQQRELPGGALGVEVDDVRFGFVDQPVFAGLNLTVEPGEVLAVVGSTGSGKSTMCQLLARIADPGEGNIRLGGVDLQDLTPADLRSAVALVFQESFLFADSIVHNIALDADFSDAEIERACGVAQASGFIARMPKGFDTVVGERGVTLSGGQRQRVALARALVRGPRLLMLDDSTSAVDPTVEAAILRGLRQSLDTTTVIVAQRVSTIELADRVVFIADGRLRGAGSHDALLADPRYEAIVRAYEEGER